MKPSILSQTLDRCWTESDRCVCVVNLFLTQGFALLTASDAMALNGAPHGLQIPSGFEHVRSSVITDTIYRLCTLPMSAIAQPGFSELLL